MSTDRLHETLRRTPTWHRVGLYGASLISAATGDRPRARGVQPGKRRKDFTPDEMKERQVLYFEQVDNLSGKATYRMHVAAASADRLITGNDSSSVNRAVASYRHIVGIPTGQEPPAAR